MYFPFMKWFVITLNILLERFENSKSASTRDGLLKFIKNSESFSQATQEIMNVSDEYKENIIEQLEGITEEVLLVAIKADGNITEKLAEEEEHYFMKYFRVMSLLHDIIAKLDIYCSLNS